MTSLAPLAQVQSESSAPRRRIVILTEDSKPALGGIAEYLHQLALATSTTHDILIVTSVPGASAYNPAIPFQYREVRWFRGQHHRTGDGISVLRRLNTLAWHVGRPSASATSLPRSMPNSPDPRT
jgi:hypothetical protein